MSRDHDLELGDLPPPGRPDPLARALADLEPAPAALNRDRLMFDAGAASRRGVVRLWQLAAGVMAAVGFAAGLNWRPPILGVGEQAAERAAPAVRAEPGPAALPAVVESSPRPAVASAVGKPRLTKGAGYWLRREHDALAVVLAVIPDRSRAARPAAWN